MESILNMKLLNNLKRNNMNPIIETLVIYCAIMITIIHINQHKKK
jgi:hypothetical protein